MNTPTPTVINAAIGLVLSASVVYAATTLAHEAREDRLQRQCAEYFELLAMGQGTSTGAILAMVGKNGESRLAEIAEVTAAILKLSDDHRRYCEFVQYGIKGEAPDGTPIPRWADKSPFAFDPYARISPRKTPLGQD